ncbi:hypothetical protein HG530_003340 [Fusarium avenaceum]|nr:hypothetical protein HG530_003340 [Fusarium avenaceum]
MARLELHNLGEVVDGVRIQLQHTERLQRNILLGDNLGSVQHIKSKLQSLVLIEDLGIEFPLRSVARLNGVPKVCTMIIGILSCKMLRLVPYETGFALLGLPVPLDELCVTVVGYQAESVHAETILYLSDAGIEMCS